MHHRSALVERSLQRSKHRLSVLLTLSSLSVAFPNQLAAACRVDSAVVRGALVGWGERYAAGRSLTRLGLAAVVVTPEGRAFEITSAGRRHARRMTSRMARRERIRRLARAPSEPDPAPRPPPARLAARAPETASFTWSVPLPARSWA